MYNLINPTTNTADTFNGWATENYTLLWYHQPNKATNLIGSNLGALMSAGYLGKDDITYLSTHYTDSTYGAVRYCPALQATDMATALAAQGTTTAADFVSSSSYLYNPHWGASILTGKWPGDANAEQGTLVSWYTKVSQYSPYFCLACDMVYSPALIAHQNKYRTINTFNLAFIDGHVASVNDKFTVNDTRWPNQLSVANDNVTTDDIIDLLETEADGRDPSKAIADPSMYAWWGDGQTNQQWMIRREQANDSSNPVAGIGADTKTDHPAVPWL
jgi:prepilin-type processing-associated H-X9-DG protein